MTAAAPTVDARRAAASTSDQRFEAKDIAEVVGRLLRSPGGVATDCLEDRGVRAIVLVSLGAIVLGSAAFGGVLGSFRGGVQILYAAVKIPLAVVATLAICAPAFHALAAAFGRPWPMRAIVSLTVAAAGRSALALLAFAPVLWLILDWHVGYHAAALAASLAYGVAGVAALGILVRGLGSSGGRSVLLGLSFVGLFFTVGGQTAWMLRPYLVRPRTEHVPFVRAREGSFSDALFWSSRSAAGIYDDSRSRPESHDDPSAEPRRPERAAPNQVAPNGESR